MALKDKTLTLTEKTVEAPQPTPQAPNAEVQELSAKLLAAQEELASLKLKQAAEAVQTEAASRNDEPITIIGLAAQGMDVLHDAIRKHNAQPAIPAYSPPPMTERQIAAREEELAAGRRTQAKAQAQWDSRPIPEKVPNEGFTTPVHRPADFVPGINSKDPGITR